MYPLASYLSFRGTVYLHKTQEDIEARARRQERSRHYHWIFESQRAADQPPFLCYGPRVDGNLVWFDERKRGYINDTPVFEPYPDPENDEKIYIAKLPYDMVWAFSDTCYVTLDRQAGNVYTVFHDSKPATSFCNVFPLVQAYKYKLLFLDGTLVDVRPYTSFMDWVLGARTKQTEDVSVQKGVFTTLIRDGELLRIERTQNKHSEQTKDLTFTMPNGAKFLSPYQGKHHEIQPIVSPNGKILVINVYRGAEFYDVSTDVPVHLASSKSMIIEFIDDERFKAAICDDYMVHEYKIKFLGYNNVEIKFFLRIVV